MPSCFTLFALSTVVSAASGGEYLLTGEGSLTLSGVMSTTLEGTLIGDWDEETNPNGTQTRPGVWGGSGNNPIPISMTLTIAFDGDTSPRGPLDLSIDDELGVATINGLAWDVLPEEVLPATLTATALYETFRSINPDSLYPGGTPVDIPLGEATATACTITQSAAGAGPATPLDGIPGAHHIVVAVPALLDLLVSSESLGELPMQFPIVLQIEGDHYIGDATDILEMTATSSLDESGDLPPEPLPTIPMELPTVLPPGDEAGVLLDLTPTTAAATLDVAAELTAAHQQSLPGDINGDGMVNTDDLLAVLAAFGPCAGCPEDIDGDGTVGVNEVLIIIDNWSV
ncbi:MAG: hypothetical protein QF561_02135 [Phycisphaerales bacterium]|jgi:hypothetical protein|nr:hypothetical protein [Phycisphaerales bacterium]